MRKKSHLSLAWGIMDANELQYDFKHRIFFYVGSIWPDCQPSFIVRRHCIDDTFFIVREKLEKLNEKFDSHTGITRSFSIQMGEIIHYVADFFTFPHNRTYTGTLKDHCTYEKYLKHAMYDYIHSKEVTERFENMHVFHSVDEILKYIQTSHQQYLSAKHTVNDDCKYIGNVCISVIASLLNMFNLETSVLITD